MTISEKLAYIKGLRDGLNLDTTRPEGRLIDAVLDVLGDISRAISDLDDQALAVSDELDEMEESLDLLETAVYEEDDDEYEEIEDDEDENEDEDDEDDEDNEDDDEEYEYDGEVIYELSCPNCGESITIDEDTLDKGSIRCPKCGEELEFDLGDEEPSAEDEND